VHGATEHTHWLSSTVLSNIAVRTGEIVRSIAVPVPHRPATPDELSLPAGRP
jgi:L-ornithine N5-monooxygenase